MRSGDIKMALSALRSSKGRSLLTMFGVIIGIVSVVTTISLGEGIKHQVIGQINHLGSDLITVRPGNLVTRDKDGNITKINTLGSFNFTSGSLTSSDLALIQHTPSIAATVPIDVVSANVSVDGTQHNDVTIIGTSDAMPAVFKQSLAYGVFFSPDELHEPVAIIGTNLADKLFQEEVPIGMTLTIHGQDFVVRGIFNKFNTSPLPLGPDFNNTVFIPYAANTGASSQLAQVIVKPQYPNDANSLIAALNRRLYNAHGQQNDFTVLKQDENLAVTSNILNLFTGFVAGLGAISLLVGGIGIVNIMFVAVTERTREIGIRKAVGATNRQILGQFLMEAIVLSLVGGLIGIGLSFVIELLIRLLTDLQPVITWQLVVLAAGVAIAIGIVFGITPAIKAARKDPIDALRYE